MQQGEHNKQSQTEYGRVNTNIWGWKWSWISLIIIVIGFIFLIFIGPKEEAEDIRIPAEQTEMQDGVNSEEIFNEE